MSSEREQKQLEDASQALAGRFQDIKTSLRDMKQILEYRHLFNSRLSLKFGPKVWLALICFTFSLLLHFYSHLILKLETDPTLNWHSFLDSYALITGTDTHFHVLLLHLPETDWSCNALEIGINFLSVFFLVELTVPVSVPTVLSKKNLLQCFGFRVLVDKGFAFVSCSQV